MARKQPPKTGLTPEETRAFAQSVGAQVNIAEQASAELFAVYADNAVSGYRVRVGKTNKNFPNLAEAAAFAVKNNLLLTPGTPAVRPLFTEKKGLHAVTSEEWDELVTCYETALRGGMPAPASYGVEDAIASLTAAIDACEDGEYGNAIDYAADAIQVIVRMKKP